MDQARVRLAQVILQNQPKPIPLNMEESLWIADAILEEFDIQDKNESATED